MAVLPCSAARVTSQGVTQTGGVTSLSTTAGFSYLYTDQWRGYEVFQSRVRYIHSSKLVSSTGKKKKNPKKLFQFSSCQHRVQSTMQGKRQAKRTRKSSSGNAEMKAGSIAWRKSKPWVAHLQAKAASQRVARLPQKCIYLSSQSDAR